MQLLKDLVRDKLMVYNSREYFHSAISVIFTKKYKCVLEVPEYHAMKAWM
jgi:hypothetical protein